MKSFCLVLGGSELHLTVDNGNNGNLASHLSRETCPFCGEATCYHDCDESVAEFVEKDSIDQSESEEEVAERREYNAFLDAVESITLAHACAGIDIGDPRYVEGLQTALDAAGNNL
jgi:hypothetical protein